MAVSERGWIHRSIEALEDELGAAKAEASNLIELEDGRRLDEGEIGATYRFELFSPVAISDGTPGLLRVERSDYPVEVLSRQELTLLLLVRNGPNGMPAKEVRRAQLRASPWFLIEALRDRMTELLLPGAQMGRAPELIRSLLQARVERAEVAGPDLLAGSERNPEQRAAIREALRNRLWFVWGPPGTGKTSTLGDLVASAATAGERVLVAAHSNVALDATLEASHKALSSRAASTWLLDHRFVVRAGQTATTSAGKLGLTARDLALGEDPHLAAALDRVDAELRIERRTKSGRMHALLAELTEIRAALATREAELLTRARIVFATLSRCSVDPLLTPESFDLVIVDEASMASPPQVVLAASLSRSRLSIFGDFRQLAPIVVSRRSETVEQLGRDVFALAGLTRGERDGKDPTGMTMLREQYRMHPEIRKLVADFAYRGKLRDGPTVPATTLHLAEVDPAPGSGVVCINAGLLGGKEWRDARRTSRCSPFSAAWSTQLALSLASEVDSVLLLSPYRAQTRLVASLAKEAGLSERVRAGTVHRFQGDEADAVVLDLVDGPTIKRLGRPLQGDSGVRLLTVGLSRAKGKLILLSHPNLMQPRPGFERTGDLLASLRQRAAQATEPEPQEVAAGDLAMTFLLDVGPAVGGIRADVADGAAAMWFPPSGMPTHFAGVRADLVGSAPDGQAIVVTTDVTWLTAAAPRGPWMAWRVESRRFANAVIDVLGAGSLRRDGTVRAPLLGVDRGLEPTATRCPECGGALHLRRRDGVVGLALECGSCGWVEDVDLTRVTGFLRQSGTTCPICGQPIRPTEAFEEIQLRCTAFPECPGSLSLA